MLPYKPGSDLPFFDNKGEQGGLRRECAWNL